MASLPSEEEVFGTALLVRSFPLDEDLFGTAILLASFPLEGDLIGTALLVVFLFLVEDLIATALLFTISQIISRHSQAPPSPSHPLRPTAAEQPLPLQLPL